MNDASTPSKGHIMQNELLTVREVAAYLRISRVTAWRWCQEGIIPAFRIGRSWRIHRDELLKLQETCGSDHRGENLEVR
jgi:excisionase family DNA binding protein